MFHSRLGCSSISFRHQELGTALRTIDGLGFEEIDLGALPGVCDHVPYYLDQPAVAAVSAEVSASGLRVRSVNGDIGDLNAVLDGDVAAGEDVQAYLARHRGRISHVHLRDAVPGNINLSIGNGNADFAGGLKRLAADGYAGHFSLELETRDVTNDERPAAAAKAASFITDLI
jgi:sugar phosphate isomerase/epimerase